MLKLDKFIKRRTSACQDYLKYLHEQDSLKNDSTKNEQEVVRKLQSY